MATALAVVINPVFIGSHVPHQSGRVHQFDGMGRVSQFPNSFLFLFFFVCCRCCCLACLRGRAAAGWMVVYKSRGWRWGRRVPQVVAIFFSFISRRTRDCVNHLYIVIPFS